LHQSDRKQGGYKQVSHVVISIKNPETAVMAIAGS
jgi:hypothetical protein